MRAEAEHDVVSRLTAAARFAAERVSIQNGAMPIAALLEFARAVPRDFSVTLDLGTHDATHLPVLLVRERSTVISAKLTPRERDVANEMARGSSNRDIALRLGITVATTKDHVHRILKKTGLSSRAAFAFAARLKS